MGPDRHHVRGNPHRQAVSRLRLPPFCLLNRDEQKLPASHVTGTTSREEARYLAGECPRRTSTGCGELLTPTTVGTLTLHSSTPIRRSSSFRLAAKQPSRARRSFALGWSQTPSNPRLRNRWAFAPLETRSWFGSATTSVEREAAWRLNSPPGEFGRSTKLGSPPGSRSI